MPPQPSSALMTGPKFVRDVISAPLEFRRRLRALTNDEVSKAVSDVTGVTLPRGNQLNGADDD